VGAALRGAGLGGAPAHFCSHLKTRFKQKLRLKYALKYVFKKNVKNHFGVGGSAPRLPRCFNRLLIQLVEFISTAPMRFIILIKQQNNCLLFIRIINSYFVVLFCLFCCFVVSLWNNKITTVNVLFLLLLHFCTCFHFKLCSFCWQGGTRIFLAPGRRVYPSYATD